MFEILLFEGDKIFKIKKNIQTAILFNVLTF